MRCFASKAEVFEHWRKVVEESMYWEPFELHDMSHHSRRYRCAKCSSLLRAVDVPSYSTNLATYSDSRIHSTQLVQPENNNHKCCTLQVTGNIYSRWKWPGSGRQHKYPKFNVQEQLPYSRFQQPAQYKSRFRCCCFPFLKQEKGFEQSENQ